MSDTLTDPGDTTQKPAAQPKPDALPKTAPGEKIVLHQITDQAGFEALEPGRYFIGPDKVKRQKPWIVKSDADLERIPEGDRFIATDDPDQKVRVKPKYEGVDLTTQTLYDMAANDKERRKVLELQYGKDAVKETSNGKLYVDVDGKRYMPGRGIQAAGGFALSAAAPTVGAVGGEVVGGPLGAAGGAIAGQSINDAILGLAGVYDRTLPEELGQAALTGGAAGAGSVVGRALGGAGGAAAAAPGALTRVAPRLAAKYVGADVDPEATRAALRLRESGVLVPPSAWMKEAPYLRTTSEVFDPTFRQQKPLTESAMNYYEKQGNALLDNLKLPKAGRESLTAPTQPVSSEEAGARLIARATQEMADKDAALQKAMSDVKANIAAKTTSASSDHAAKLAALRQAHQDALDAAQNIVNQGFKSIEDDVAAAKKAAAVGDSPGDSVRAAERKIRGINRAIKARAGIQYEAADAMAGDVRPALRYTTTVNGKPQTVDLVQAGKDFLASLPEAFQAKYPDIVKRITMLGGSNSVTFGQLRNLRSLIRQDIDYNDLTPSMRDGVYKHFNNVIDGVIHNQEQPALKEAAKMLDATDAYYAKNIKKFNDGVVKWIVDSVEAGVPPNAEMMASKIMTKDQAERIGMIRKLLGPGLWNQVQHADVKAMLDSSQTTVPGVLDGKVFADQVLGRIRDGVLKNAYSPELAARLTAQANRILAMEGKLPVQRAGDESLASVMDRADRIAKEIEVAAKSDPIGTLDKTLKKVEGEFRGRRTEMLKAMRKDPLSFLYDAGAGPIESANRILNNPDLFMAAANKFGVDSPEFEMLRQVAAQRLLQTSSPGTLLGKLSSAKLPESVQQLIFPGSSRDDLVRLAKDMSFLLGGTGGDQSGSSIAAQSRVLHPFGSIPIGGKLIEKVPGAAAGGRAALSAYYKFITNTVNSPWVMKFIAKGLDGTDADREAAKQMFLKWARVGGATGAGVGEAVGQGTRE